MKVAVVGSRTLEISNLEKYLPPDVTEIISGGAKGIDQCARDWAIAHNVPLVEFLPEYERYGKYAPRRRNMLIVDRADFVIAFWDGESRGTFDAMFHCWRHHIPIEIYEMRPGGEPHCWHWPRDTKPRTHPT